MKQSHSASLGEQWWELLQYALLWSATNIDTETSNDFILREAKLLDSITDYISDFKFSGINVKLNPETFHFVLPSQLSPWSSFNDAHCRLCQCRVGLEFQNRKGNKKRTSLSKQPTPAALTWKEFRFRNFPNVLSYRFNVDVSWPRMRFHCKQFPKNKQLDIIVLGTWIIFCGNYVHARRQESRCQVILELFRHLRTLPKIMNCFMHKIFTHHCSGNGKISLRTKTRMSEFFLSKGICSFESKNCVASPEKKKRHKKLKLPVMFNVSLIFSATYAKS